MRALIASPVATAHPGRLAGRLLRVGAVVLAIGVLIYFAARSESGGLAGILLSGLLASITVGTALMVVKGTWRESERLRPRHAVLSGCLTAVALCGSGGVFLCFGNQLLLGSIVGIFAAFMNDRQGWISWQQVIGIDPELPSLPGTPPAPQPWSPLGGPGATAAAATLTVVLLVVGIFFGALGTIRAVEGVSAIADFGCTAPCGLMHGLWVQVLPDAHGKVVSQDGSTIQLRLAFRDDAPGQRVTSSSNFTLSDSKATYSGCGSWTLTTHIDDTTGTKNMCFSVPPEATVDPSQLVLKWSAFGAEVMIPLGSPYLSFQIG